MKIVLKKDLKGLGYVGDILEVAAGYARNFLIPKKIAVFATSGEIKNSEKIRQNRIAKIKEFEKNIEKLASKLQKAPLVFSRKVSKNEKLFAGISENDVCKKIRDDYKIEIEKSNIVFKNGHPKTLGDYPVEIKLFEGRSVEILLKIEKEE